MLYFLKSILKLSNIFALSLSLSLSLSLAKSLTHFHSLSLPLSLSLSLSPSLIPKLIMGYNPLMSPEYTLIIYAGTALMVLLLIRFCKRRWPGEKPKLSYRAKIRRRRYDKYIMLEKIEEEEEIQGEDLV